MTQSRQEAWEAAAARLRARLFEWMLQHHDRLAGPLAGGPLDWHSLAGALAAAGLTDPAGAPPSPETARRVWLRACRFVAARRRREAAALAGPALGGAGLRAGAEATPGRAAPRELAPEDVALVGRQ
jgi:hypothetical protein